MKKNSLNLKSVLVGGVLICIMIIASLPAFPQTDNSDEALRLSNVGNGNHIINSDTNEVDSQGIKAENNYIDMVSSSYTSLFDFLRDRYSTDGFRDLKEKIKEMEETGWKPDNVINWDNYTYPLKVFQSYNEIIDFVDSFFENVFYRGYLEWDSGITIPSSAPTKDGFTLNSAGALGGESLDYSLTNVQVEGVDEPDIVKTDGYYVYAISKQNLFIIDVYPPSNAHVTSKIALDDNVSPWEMFIHGDTLIVFCSSYRSFTPGDNNRYWYNGVSTTVINVFDISNRSNPNKITDITVDGNYFDSRMIGEWVYVVINEFYYDLITYVDDNKTLNIPTICINGIERGIEPTDILYVETPINPDTLTHVLAINIKDMEKTSHKSFMLGNAQEIYVSHGNIFIASGGYGLWNLEGENTEATVIHKISLDEGTVSYVAQGEVPGRVLNQFSMDEYNSFFRIATTQGSLWGGSSSNNVYILDYNLTIVSKLEDIAPGESIYSARFMGDKAYLVTFKKIDPFFTLDLSDPFNPKILGELKISGYSDYLHPYDETHIIGIGKETVEPLDTDKWSRDSDFVWYQGLKIAVFDVSDFENPREITKVIIGDRGTDSPVLHDHKALLFDKEKELFVIPVSLYEISDEIKAQNNNYTGSMYGDFSFQGAYVYQLNLNEGFQLMTRVSHLNDTNASTSIYIRGFNNNLFINRCMYIEDALCTISDGMIKLNNLHTFNELSSVTLK